MLLNIRCRCKLTEIKYPKVNTHFTDHSVLLRAQAVSTLFVHRCLHEVCPLKRVFDNQLEVLGKERIKSMSLDHICVVPRNVPSTCSKSLPCPFHLEAI